MIFRDAPLGWGYYREFGSRVYFVVKADPKYSLWLDTRGRVKEHRNRADSEISYPSFFLPVGVV